VATWVTKEGNIVLIGQRLPSERLAPEDAPPPLDQIEPGRSHRDEGVLDAGMGRKPLPDRATAVTGEVIGHQVEVPSRVRAVYGLEQLEIATSIPGACRLGERLPIPDAQRPIDPDFLQSAVVVEGHFDAVPVG
jgi:hypothetical protein